MSSIKLFKVVIYTTDRSITFKYPTFGLAMKKYKELTGLEDDLNNKIPLESITAIGYRVNLQKI